MRSLHLLLFFFSSIGLWAKGPVPEWYQALVRQNGLPQVPHENLWVEGVRDIWADSFIYRLAYVDERAPPRRYVQNLLQAITLQRGQIDHYLDAIPGYPIDADVKPPSNVWKVNIALGIFNVLHPSKEEQSFVDAYDLRSAGRGPLKNFSGLPFFNLMRERIFDQSFQAQVLDLKNRLEEILKAYAQNPHFELNTNLLDLAMQTTKNDRTRAIEILGLLLSRDTEITSYFPWIVSRNRPFMEAMGIFPLYVRLIAELDKGQRNSLSDRFSYDGIYSTNNVKSYFFWSSALVAQRLEQQGWPKDKVQRMNLEFIKFYKKLRYFENWGFLKSLERRPINYRSFWLGDAREVLWEGARGAQLVLSPRNSCSELLECLPVCPKIPRLPKVAK